MPIDSLRRRKVLAFLAALAVHIFAETFVQFKDTTSTTSALRGQVQSKATEATDSETFPKSPMPMAKVTGTDAEVDPSNPSNTDTKPLSYYAGMLTNPPSEEDSEKDMITPTLKFIGYGAVFGFAYLALFIGLNSEGAPWVLQCHSDHLLSNWPSSLHVELSIHELAVTKDELAEEVVSVITNQTGCKLSNASSDKVEMVRG